MLRLIPLVFFSTLIAAAQTSTLPSAPQPQPGSVHAYSFDDDRYFAALGAGAGFASTGFNHSITAQFAAAAGISTLGRGNTGFQQFIEAGTLGPFPDRLAPAAFLGYDLGLNAARGREPGSIAFVVGGYTYVFTEGSAINFGVGLDHFYSAERGLRFEVRDYFLFTDKPQHNAAFRVSWIVGAHNP